MDREGEEQRDENTGAKVQGRKQHFAPISRRSVSTGWRIDRMCAEEVVALRDFVLFVSCCAFSVFLYFYHLAPNLPKKHAKPPADSSTGHA